MREADAQGDQPVGYYLGGWDAGTHLPSCSRVLLHGKQVDRAALGIGQAYFDGAPEFFRRVFFGYDGHLPARLLIELKRILPDQPADFDARFDEALREAARELAAVGFRDIPIREAIDYVHTYIHITVKAFKFRFGPPICGGPIEVGFVSTDRPFRWVTHKPFGSATFEQETTAWPTQRD